jgi:hypothetical protein
MNFSTAAALAVLGAIAWASPLEFGTFGLLFAGALLLAIALIGDPRARLNRMGGYLLGGGIGGGALLLFDLVRIGNVCGSPGGQVQTPTGTSYACYSIETLWFFLPYAVLMCLGALMLFLARKPQRAIRS